MRKRAKKCEEMVGVEEQNKYSPKKAENAWKIRRNCEKNITFFYKRYCNRQMTMIEYRNKVVEKGVFSPRNGGKG